MVISCQGDRKPSSAEPSGPMFEVSFGMCSTTDGDSRNPHLLTEHYLQALIDDSSSSLYQFMKVGNPLPYHSRHAAVYPLVNLMSFCTGALRHSPATHRNTTPSISRLHRPLPQRCKTLSSLTYLIRRVSLSLMHRLSTVCFRKRRHFQRLQ